MIGYIKGVIEEIEENSILLDHGGMGFRINMPAALLDRNAHKGDQVKIYTHLQVKEDDMQLYGFYTRDDLEVFRLLLNVSGIGPKGAMNILSVFSARTSSCPWASFFSKASSSRNLSFSSRISF